MGGTADGRVGELSRMVAADKQEDDETHKPRVVQTAGPCVCCKGAWADSGED